MCPQNERRETNIKISKLRGSEKGPSIIIAIHVIDTKQDIQTARFYKIHKAKVLRSWNDDTISKVSLAIAEDKSICRKPEVRPLLEEASIDLQCQDHPLHFHLYRLILIQLVCELHQLTI